MPQDCGQHFQSTSSDPRLPCTGTDCHHIIVEDWKAMEKPKGTLFVSIPSLLDPSLAPPGTHIFHAFTPDWIEAYQVLYGLAV